MKMLFTFLLIAQTAVTSPALTRDLTAENPKSNNAAAPKIVCGDLEFCVNVVSIPAAHYKYYEVDPASILNGTPVYYRWYVNGVLIIEGSEEIGCLARNRTGSIIVVITDSEGCDTSFAVSTTTPGGSSVCNS